MTWLRKLVQGEAGQDLVEYAMLVAFIAAACILGLQQLGTTINNTYGSVSSSLVISGS